MKKFNRLLIIAFGIIVAVYIAFQPDQVSKSPDKVVFHPSSNGNF